MKFSKTDQNKSSSYVEMMLNADVTHYLIQKNNKQPENEAPSCPMKLHSFLVMASFETLWRENLALPSTISNGLGKN